MRSLMCYVLLLECITFVINHSYHFGVCPVVEPMSSFQMNKFFGIWHVIQKTSTASKCIKYNYTRGEEPGEYIITQDSDIPILGLTSWKHEYHYTGTLNVIEPSVPARMTVRFPLNVAGSALHVIFATDYENYAGIFTCQKLAIIHRQSATILSRTHDLDKVYVDKIRQKLTSFGIDPFDLSIISQTHCFRGNNTFDINVNPNIFTTNSFSNIIRKAGQKIGNGVEWIGHQGSIADHKITGGEIKSDKNVTETMSKNVTSLLKNRYEKYKNNEVEWIP